MLRWWLQRMSGPGPGITQYSADRAADLFRLLDQNGDGEYSALLAGDGGYWQLVVVVVAGDGGGW